MSGNVILLIGTSSAGKSTLARELEEILPSPHLLFSLDAFFAMVPKPWGGARGGPLSRDGFRYEENEIDGVPAKRIGYGDYGWRVLTGMHDAAAALAHAGLDLVIDEMLLDRRVYEDWARALREVDVLVVRVECALPDLEARERARGSRIGLARGHLSDNEVPADLVVDTGAVSPEVAAREVAEFEGQRTAFG